jgi:hypothetical protein
MFNQEKIMKKIFSISLVCFLAGSFYLHAGSASSYAPIGVMGDHVHAKCQWMASYQFMSMSMDGHRQGSQRLSAHDVYSLGYDSAATSMDMDMHMLGLMKSLHDRLTLMVMANYVEKDMGLASNPMAAMTGHGGHAMHSRAHGHSSSGLGDLKLVGLLPLCEQGIHRLQAGIGVSFPTGDVDKRDMGLFLPYGMQPGSGTYDFLPSLTYLARTKQWSWGGQVSGEYRLESKGSTGYALGDQVRLTSWVAKDVLDHISSSLRLDFSSQETIDGHYDGPHGHSAPPFVQGNYGGEILQLAVGMNVVIPGGILQGHRLAVEYSIPLSQDLNGIGMNLDDSWLFGWQKAW